MLQVFYDDVNLLTIESKEKGLENLKCDKLGLKFISKIQNKSLINYKFSIDDCDYGDTLSYDEIEYPIIYRGIVKTEWFMNRYDARDEKMGSWVNDDKTYFSVYAPTAKSMDVILGDKSYPMIRKDNGSFYLSLDFNAHGMQYLYRVNIYGQERTTTDPYAIASLPNRSHSVVVDLNQLNLDVSPLKVPVEKAIILEASVRDFSMDPEVEFKHRGKFLGMIESHGDYGMNHIKDLGITHLQLMPVNDFETVDELDPFSKYNWGYDTMQFMSLEGSYSSDVHNPLQAIYDFSKLVDIYHKHNIGINIDVVFNHIYEMDDHPLHILLPYYYFRYEDDYSLSNGSFCGNEIASEMPMCRKLIVDTTTHFVYLYKIDGFRFDLMGLLDVDTMNAVYNACHKINPNIMIYGEGWKMPTVLPEHMQASMHNYHLMPMISHFNDKFRDTVAGKLNDTDLGYAGDNVALTNIIKSGLSGFSDNTYTDTMFDTSKKSVNYVECHDNMTVADKVSLADKGKKEALFMMGLVLFSQGIPFLQIGQSFFRDKKGDENSYKSPDSVNRIDWSLLDKNKEMHKQVKEWIKIRKEIYQTQEDYSFKEEDGLLHYYYGPYHLIFNPTDKKENIPAKSISIQKHS